MNIKKILIGTGLIIVGVPIVLILAAVVTWYFIDDRSGTLVSSGETREYLLYVPDSYDAARPTPLVISMHGTALWPANQMSVSDWNSLADEEGFIVVYPSAIDFPKMWRLEPGEGLDADIQYISRLIDTLESTYNIDSLRIYANGLSAGGGVATMLACLLPDRIAAIGTVATAHLPSDWCETRNRYH